MAVNTKRKYPEPVELLALAKQYRSVAQVARAVGLSPSTLRDHLVRIGMLDEFRQLCVAPVEIDPDAEQSEVQMLRQENEELRKALSATHSESVREARVINAINKAVSGKSALYKPNPIPKSEKRTPHTLFLMWSDLHAGEIVSAEETNGANSYNWEIMLKRHEELRRGVYSFAERFGPVEEIVIGGLGDMVGGNIHQELAESNEMPMSEVIVQLGLDGADFIQSFTDLAPVRFAGVTGNHGRFTVKPRAKQRYDNGDWLAYQIMRQRLSKDSNITFDVPKPGRFPVEIYDRRILLLHGDGIRSTMVGVPWGGIIRQTNLLTNQYAALGMPIDHYALGHYHEPNAVSNRRILMNGSVKGIDEYSLERHGGGSHPAQLLVPFHPKWGLVGVHFIDLEPKLTEARETIDVAE